MQLSPLQSCFIYNFYDSRWCFVAKYTNRHRFRRETLHYFARQRWRDLTRARGKYKSQRISTEREFLRLLDAGCHTPVGVYSSLVGDVLHLKALVFPETGGEPMSGEASGSDPLEVAEALFQSLK